MGTSIFNDKKEIPDDKKLALAVGDAIVVYNVILDYLNSQYDGINPQWKYYGKNTGWILKLLYKKRNLFFLLPCQGFFKISFVFGSKAIAEIEKSDIPDSIKTELRNAKQYVEGKGIQLEVKTKSIIKLLKQLLKFKIEN